MSPEGQCWSTCVHKRDFCQILLTYMSSHSKATPINCLMHRRDGRYDLSDLRNGKDASYPQNQSMLMWFAPAFGFFSVFFWSVRFGQGDSAFFCFLVTDACGVHMRITLHFWGNILNGRWAVGRKKVYFNPGKMAPA